MELKNDNDDMMDHIDVDENGDFLSNSPQKLSCNRIEAFK